MVILGDKAKDSISGFEGIVTGHATYLHGCIQLLLTPEKTNNGALLEGHWFDEQRITDAVTATAGGPQQEAPKH